MRKKVSAEKSQCRRKFGAQRSTAVPAKKVEICAKFMLRSNSSKVNSFVYFLLATTRTGVSESF